MMPVINREPLFWQDKLEHLHREGLVTLVPHSIRSALGACRRIPSLARERPIFSSDKDEEAGNVCFIADTTGCSQAEKGPLKARSSSPTGS